MIGGGIKVRERREERRGGREGRIGEGRPCYLFSPPLWLSDSHHQYHTDNKPRK